jgi:thiol-disulfide isomerase/thioredoxin
MSLTPTAPPSRSSVRRYVLTALALGAAIAAGLSLYSYNCQGQQPPSRTPIPAPELEGGVAYLNTAGPIRLKDLRGKIVVLDFWTLCCINCMHTLPDLAKLEKKYPNELVVIGIHSPKFENEHNTESIRKALLRYEVKHPVINDANMQIWKTFGVNTWPTLVLIDPEGNIAGHGSGEGLYDALDVAIAKLIKTHKANKTLNEKPLKFELAKETGESPLFFPGKVLADGPSNRLFIADSTHHRIVITDLDGKKIAVAGTGEPGNKDGDFDKAQFHDPQGLAVKGDTLYVADRKNHTIRELDLKAKTVKTIAGTGKQAQARDVTGPFPARKIALNSPWDLLLAGNTLYVALAGHHQIWALDLRKDELTRYAGTGYEFLKDGPLLSAIFAQPSGLASDGKNLYVADSEVSAIRMMPLNGRGEVKTLIGEHLFAFGDITYNPALRLVVGAAEMCTYRLQHALGIVCVNGKIYVADTYNSKVKELDPETRRITTFVGGESEGWLSSPVFQEPAGISYANGKLYLADTNAHRIRVVDMKTRAVSTLKLQGVEAPKLTP